MHLRRFCFLTTLLTACAWNLWPQTPPAEPSDPVALMSAARDKNGLQGQGIRPWHIRGTYHLYGKKGAVDDAGVFEEWWISPTKYKRMIAGKSFSQIDYANGQGLFRAGAQDWPSGAMMLLRETLTDPLPDTTAVKEFTLQKTTLPVGQTVLTCVVLTYPVRADLRVTGDTFPAACFDPKLPVLRIYSSSNGAYRAVLDTYVAFQGHYLAKQVRLSTKEGPLADLTLDTVENLADATDAAVAPPDEAKPIDLSAIVLSEDSARRFPQQLKVSVPEYPPIARNIRAEGVVVLEGTIGSDGRPRDLKAIGGPEVLYHSALDAVGQWIYRPFEVMGEARSIKLKIKVIFNLG